MGQSSSSPVVDGAHHRENPNPAKKNNNSNIPHRNSTPNHKNDATKEPLKVPSAWKTKPQHRRTNSDNFVMISPQSDISNPSHFRGLFAHPHAPPAAATGNAKPGNPQPTQYHHHHHRRTSKVISKISPPPFVKQKLYSTASTAQRRRTTSDLHKTPPPPIPARFYFQGHDEDDGDSIGSEKNENDEKETNTGHAPKVHHMPQKQTNEEDNPGPERRDSKNLKAATQNANKTPKKSTMNNHKKTKKNRTTIPSKFTRKCIKAKTALSECWKDHVLQNEEAPPNVQRHYSQRQMVALPSQLPTKNETNGKPFVPLFPNNDSFQPVWKETNVVLSSSSEDDQKNLTSVNDETKQAPVREKQNTKSNTGTMGDVVPTGHVRDIIRTFSHETNTSTVLQTSKTTTTISGTTAVSTIVQLYPPYSKKESETAIVSTVKPTSVSIFRPSYTSTNTGANNEMQTKIELRPTLTTTSTSTTSEATSTKSSSTTMSNVQTSRKRASIEKKLNSHQSDHRTSTSNVSVPAHAKPTVMKDITNNVVDRDHKRRSEISIEMQRQIDQQLSDDMQSNSIAASKKVQRLRQQYQNDISEKKKIFGYGNGGINVHVPDKAPNNTVLLTVTRTMSVAEARKAFENNNHRSVVPVSSMKPRNATSVPNRKSYEHDHSTKTVDANTAKEQPRQQTSMAISTTTSRTNDRRSISVPRGGRISRPSIDRSALLLLSKSWDVAEPNKDKNRLSQSSSQPTPQLPVLLQMAGWKPPALEKSKKSSNDVVKSHSTTAYHTNVKLTRAEGTVSDTTLPPVTTTQKAPSPPVLHQLDKPADTRKVTKKAKSFDHVTKLVSQAQYSKDMFPVVRKSTGNTSTVTGGRTIAYMLQQAYFGNDSDNDDDDVKDHENSSGNRTKHLQSPETRVNSLVDCSPALSIDSVSTHNSMPVVSDQAIFNSDFLFSQDGYNMYATSAEHSSSRSTTLLLESDNMNRKDNVISTCIDNQSGPTSFTLSTMDSRSRIITSTASVSSTIDTIVHRPTISSSVATIVQEIGKVEAAHDQAPSLRVEGSVSSASTLTLPRRVRFSEESVLLKNEDATTTNTIETKFSDLTESTVVTQVQPQRESTSGSIIAIPRIDSIPEEDEDNDNNLEGEQKVTPNKEKTASAIMRWSYRTSATLSTSSTSPEERGVTPLLGNKSKSNATCGSPQEMNKKPYQRTTNSPYLRFQQAKERFASSSTSTGIATKKYIPQKRTSPIKAMKKSNAIVTARIASMEKKKRQGFVRCNSSIDSNSVLKAPTLNQHHADLTKDDSLPHSSFLQRVQRRLQHASSPKQFDATLPIPTPVAVIQPSGDKCDDASYHETSNKNMSSNSPVLINGQVISSPSPVKLTGHLHALSTGLTSDANMLDESASVVSYDSDDVFGAILHPTTIDDSDEDNDVTQSDGGDDEFDRVLNYTESYDEEQQASIDGHHKETTDSSFLPSKTSQTSRTRNTAGSVASVASSSGDTASVVPHWLLQHGGHHRTSVVTTTSDSSSVMSAVSRMKNIHNKHSVTGISQPLPFRAVAPVKPVDQHRQLNQQQTNEAKSVVEPPRTWRKLAVAAQKQDMKHLHQTNGATKENTTGGDYNHTNRSVQQQRFFYDRSNLQ